MKTCRICDVGLMTGQGHHCLNCKPIALGRRAHAKAVHSIVNQAIKQGSLIKALLCEVCDKHKPLQGHHADYNYALDVIWVCDDDHKAIHRNCDVIYATI